MGQGERQQFFVGLGGGVYNEGIEKELPSGVRALVLSL